MLEQNKTFYLPTDPTQKFRVGKGQTKYFFNLGLMYLILLFGFIHF